MKIPRYNLAILDFALNVFSLTLPIWAYHIKEQASRIFYSDSKHKRAWQGMFWRQENEENGWKINAMIFSVLGWFGNSADSVVFP